MKEPYFMQQIHKEREKEAKILWTRFSGNFYKYHQLRMKNLQQDLEKAGWHLRVGHRGEQRLVEF
ncbi:hypothetical protein KKD19_06285 [Patescibacteria group bacterium]|nr:hypothetical protein [Patescibacteria group bacterium]MBU4512812.1 hypothetical protein [Patescibacteria group bacterium]MCG2693215.1 hypothetical protein [Candidatus Parcubacteria bacterium]